MRLIEYIRRDKGLSQRALGAKTHVDAGYVCTAEKYGFARGVRLKRIADTLGWYGQPEQLLEEATPEAIARYFDEAEGVE